MFYQEFLCITLGLSIITKESKQQKTKQNKTEKKWNQENLTCDSMTVQTILTHISEEENYLGAFLFPVVSPLCPSQPTRLPSNPS